MYYVAVERQVRHVESRKALVHIETTDEKLFRLLNTDIRRLVRHGNSFGAITFSPELAQHLDVKLGDQVLIFKFDSFEVLEGLRDELRAIIGRSGGRCLLLVRRSEES